MIDIPPWSYFLAPALTSMSDGVTRSMSEATARIATSVGLTDDQLAERFEASREPIARNRIWWAMDSLVRAGALSRPQRAHFVITEFGRRVLAEHSNGLTEKELKAAAGGVADTALAPDLVMATTVLDPIEQIEQGVARIHADVASDLLKRLHAQAPAFFEQAVLDLLMAMGYGGAEGKATRTQLSNDGGIDGIIDQDALGLSRIYVQAKRYTPDSAVGRPDIQSFVGALHGNKAGQGVFITTARFSSGAQQYAKEVPTPVVLIDGARLASLMIRYGVGVQVRRTVSLVEIDEDFFE